MTTGAPSQRLAALDGLRGWAALSVIVYHLSWEMFGGLYGPLHGLQVALVANGNFAVALFLMVSGYVLTARGWRNPDKTAIRRSILKRYFRLTIPIAASVLLFWAVIALGWARAPAAAPLVNSVGWLGHFGNFPPDFLAALSFGLVGVYVRASSTSYGPFLWTMTTELWGSYVVLLVCLFELPGRWSYVTLAILTVLGLVMPLDPYFPLAACYPAGALVALLVRDGVIPSGPATSSQSRLATSVVAVSVVVVALVQVYELNVAITAVLAMLSFVAALRSGPISRWLALPVSQWLGQISFPLYLLQIVVITTISSNLILAADAAHLLSPWTALGIGLVSLAACLAAAQLFMPIERLALRVSNAVGARLRTRARA